MPRPKCKMQNAKCEMMNWVRIIFFGLISVLVVTEITAQTPQDRLKQMRSTVVEQSDDLKGIRGGGQ
jgi:plasmid rolling circle replication initiator protein Rep